MVEDEQGRNHAMRASDAEREEALRSLATHFAEGRLDRAEFDQRADAALEARTCDELNALFLDLPARPSAVVARRGDEARARARPGLAPTGPGRRPPIRPGAARPLFPLVPVLLALSVLAVVHGLPPFPLVALFALAAANRRRGRFGNDKD